MLVGLDFDNTIVRYDRLFHQLAVERGLIPTTLPATKHSVREHLRASGREDAWTELQGVAYGPRIVDAELFPGLLEFLARCRESGVDVAVVSHKTRRPYRGEQHDLHAAAHAFLEAKGLYRSGGAGLSRDRVYLELTLAEKLRRIRDVGCKFFVDDLPEVLLEPAFPTSVHRVLFDFSAAHAAHSDYHLVKSWAECGDLVLAGQEVHS
jgi:hypothetical protein